MHPLTSQKLDGPAVPTAATESPEGSNDCPYEASGRHALATFENCTQSLLTDEARLCAIVRDAATASGATVLQIASHSFDPPGVTVVAVLAESHASLHTYPHAGIVFWDCFTCGTACDPSRSVEFLTEVLQPSAVRAQVVERS
ncbi:MAG: adenosylmethionine decarboxylase [Candidatus Obscuribacterales bacterium]|nr:adenosylmethionine decarboxylase [Candidatus Obscuribacterales bacterium]